MTIKHKKKNGKVYLEEYKSVRIAGKVKSIYVRSIGPENPVRRPKQPKPKVLDRLEHDPSYRAGDVSILWKIASELDVVNIIDKVCCGQINVDGPSPGKMLTAWAINRALEADSCTQLERWITTTDLPRLMGLSPADFSKDAFLSSLDFVCYKDNRSNRIVDYTVTIDDALYQKWRQNNPLPEGEKETLAYDLTTVLFFGETCPLAEFGHNPNKIKRRQVNLALLVSKLDKCPIAHFVFNGSRNSSSTVKNFITWLTGTLIEPGTILWDRGNVSEEHVNILESTGWNLICGVPKSSTEVSNIINETDVALTPVNFVHKSKSDHIYAVKTNKHLFGKLRPVIVYTNQDKRNKKINARNEALSTITEELEELSERGKNRSEAKLHKEIKKIVGVWKDFVHTRVKRKSTGPRIEWNYRTREIEDAARSYGKYLLHSTDASLSVKEVVKDYFEKDFIEKVFRTFKTDEEMEPVRHRLEHRVRAYIFVCVLAFRLLANLQYRLQKISSNGDTWESSNSLLRDLKRVERVQIRLGHKVKTWFLNLKKKNKEILEKIGFFNIFEETIQVDFKL